MGNIGKTYAGAGGRALAGLQFLDDALANRRELPQRHQVTWGIVSLISTLWLIGWVLAL